MRSTFDLKHNLGKITVETNEDLNILKDIITAGSLVTAKTPRSVKVRRQGELVRPKTGKKEVILTIEVEKVDIQDKLRLTGKIVEAPEDVEKGYHSIEVEPGTFLKIEREWKSWEIDRIKSTERKPEPILICILDDSEADFYFLKERYKHLFHMASEVSGKRFEMKKVEEKRKEYYSKIINELKNRADKVKKIVLAGPAFTKEDVKKLVKEREKEILDKIIIEHTYDTGDVGLQQLLKAGLIEKLTKFSRISEETNAVENILNEIRKGGRACYGIEVKEAVGNGLVDILLVSDKKIHDFEDILEAAERHRVKIMVIDSSHPAGEKLLGLGGIAALLKSKIS